MVGFPLLSVLFSLKCCTHVTAVGGGWSYREVWNFLPLPGGCGLLGHDSDAAGSVSKKQIDILVREGVGGWGGVGGGWGVGT